MTKQIKCRRLVPALLMVMTCAGGGALAQTLESPAATRPAVVPAAPTAPTTAPLPGSAGQPFSAAPAAAPSQEVASSPAAAPSGPSPAAAPSLVSAPATGSAPTPDVGPDPMTLLTGSPSCFLSPLAIDPAAIASFRAAPQSLVTPYPDGGVRMAQDVRGLAGTDVHTVPILIDLARNATAGQTAAIGAGLAQTARACVRQRPDIAQIIQQLIIRAGLAPLTTAFVSSSGDVATAATGGAAAGGGAASAGGIGGSPGGGDTSGAGGGVASSGGVSLTRSRANLSTFGAGGSSVTINITLGGGSVSPVR